LEPTLDRFITPQRLQDTKGMNEGWRQVQRASWEKRAGSLLPQMFQSRKSAERLLGHPEPSVRIVALEVLDEQWKPDAHLAKACEQMAFGDADLQVRAVALLVLASCFEYTDDRRIGRMLGTIVRDERQPTELRLAAYHALFTLRGKVFIWDRLYGIPEASWSFADAIDWPFVDSFIDQSTTSSPIDPLRASSPDLSEAEVDAIRLYRRGIEAMEHRDYQECVRSLSVLLDSVPYAAGAAYLRGCANIELGRLDEAIADLSRAIEADPSCAKSLRERGRAYRLRGMIALAERDERAAASIQNSETREKK
jgi:hypothetical protein